MRKALVIGILSLFAVALFRASPAQAGEAQKTGSLAAPSGSWPAANPPPPSPEFIPIQQATALTDGSIIHIVQTGQTLEGIAFVYDVSLEDLFTYNDLTASSFIHPGDEIIVRPARTPTPTISPTPTNTPSPTVTQTPTPTITARPALALAATAEREVTLTPTATQLTAAALIDTQSTRGRLLLAIIAGAFLFLLVPFIGALRRK